MPTWSQRDVANFVRVCGSTEVTATSAAIKVVKGWVAKVPVPEQCDFLAVALSSLSASRTTSDYFVDAIKRMHRKLKSIALLESQFPGKDFIPTTVRPSKLSDRLIQNTLDS